MALSSRHGSWVASVAAALLLAALAGCGGDADEVCAWYTAAESGNQVVAKSEDGETQTEVELTGKGATGTVELSDGETARYDAREATATSGVYDLSVTRKGKVTGASAAG